jgi:copper chaperone CopZ
MPRKLLPLTALSVVLGLAAFAFFFKSESLSSATIRIPGMSCPACVDRVAHMLNALEGVKTAEVSFSEGHARVQYDPTLMTVAAMENAISKLGFGTENFEAQSGAPQKQCETNQSSPMDCCAPQDKRSDT